MRLIGVDALIKLAIIKEDSDDLETSKKVRSLLVPFEYTRVDALVEVVFTAAKDTDKSVLEEAASVQADIASGTSKKNDFGPEDGGAAEIAAARAQIIAALSDAKKMNFIKKTRATFWTADHGVRVACTLSKKYGKEGHYWYAFHPAWNEFLNEAKEAYCVFGCLGLSRAFVLPIGVLQPILPHLDQTVKEDRYYWHVRLKPDSSGAVAIVVPGQPNLLLEEFALEVPQQV